MCPIKKLPLTVLCNKRTIIHLQDRKKIIKIIATIIITRKRNITKEWIIKVPELARHLELRLCKNASSLKEHSNIYTLPSRLMNIATEINEIQIIRQIGKS